LPNVGAMHWSLDTLDSVSLWRPSEPPPGAIVAATTRVGGVSPAPFETLNLGKSTADDPAAVEENRRRVLAALGIPDGRLATAGQVHGTRVTEVHTPGLHVETDALVTREPGLALAVSGADCLPLLAVAPGAVAAAHSGWRGTAAGMPAEVVRALLALSKASPIDVRVYLGPCIGSCCYHVGEDVAARFPAEAVIRDDAGIRVDLAGAARRQVEALGVPRAAIVDPPACTSHHPEWCYSHRRDHGRTGRLWGVVALDPDARLRRDGAV